MPFTHRVPRRGSLALLLGLCLAGVPAPAASATLTLDDALRLTREHHPRIAAARLGAEAARHARRDAGRLTNPALEASAENFGGGLDPDGRELTVTIAQPLEIGGDRAARAGLAGARAGAADAATLQTALDQRLVTVERFLDAWVLQERLRQVERSTSIARDAVATARERHRSGAAPAYEARRAERFLAIQDIAYGRAAADLAAARQRLALQWNGVVAVDSLALPPPDEATRAAHTAVTVPEHPDLVAAAAAVTESEWRLRHARAARVPDIEVAAGLRHFAGTADVGFLAGLSIGLPIWNARRGEIAAAEAERDAAATLTRSLRQELETEAAVAARLLDAALERWRRLRDDVLPAATEAMEGVTAAYRAGRAASIEVQEGQRDLIETELLAIESRADVWRAHHRLESLLRPEGGAR